MPRSKQTEEAPQPEQQPAFPTESAAPMPEPAPPGPAQAEGTTTAQGLSSLTGAPTARQAVDSGQIMPQPTYSGRDDVLVTATGGVQNQLPYADPSNELNPEAVEREKARWTEQNVQGRAEENKA